jgi:hypothetical protein
MEVIPDPRTSPADLTVETVQEWSLGLTDVERRIGARFPRGDVRGRICGAYAVRRSAKTAGSWQKSTAMRRHMGGCICEGMPYGMPMPCGTIYARI